MYRRFLAILILAAALLAPTDSSSSGMAARIVRFRLANGMRWFIVRRTQAPVFSGIVMVRAGGVDERTGKTGVAHMFEHMAFKGSSRLGTKDWKRERKILKKIEKLGAELTAIENGESPDVERTAAIKKEMAALKKEASRYQVENEVWELFMRNGGKGINAYTSKDVTAFFASMPSNRLALWANVTAEMVFRPAFRDFYTERSVVAEERRTGVENSPNGALVEKLLSSAFRTGPYSWSTIGLEEDVVGLTIGDAREFHSENYTPSNMVGVIVGDVDVARAKRIVAGAFGGFPNRKRPPERKTGDVAVGGVETEFGFDAAPAVAVAWHKPTLPDPSEYTFDVILSLLCDGSSSRLKKRLVYDRRLAKEVFCSDAFPGSRLENLFLIWVEPLKGRSPKKILRIIDEEISRLTKEPVSEQDLARVRKQVSAGLMFALDANEKLAEELARFETIFGDWKLLFDYPDRVAKVTKEDVMRIAKKYLIDSNRIVVERERRR